MDKDLLLKEIDKYYKELPIDSFNRLSIIDICILLKNDKQKKKILINNEYGLLGNLLNKNIYNLDNSILKEICISDISNYRNLNIIPIISKIKKFIKNDEWIYKEIFSDREVILRIIRKKLEIIEYISDELKNDKEVVLEAIKQNVSTLEYASDELKNNKKFILDVVKQNGTALQYISDELRNDKEVVLVATKQNPYALKYASDELKNDKEVVFV